MYKLFESKENAKNAFYHMASKAEFTDFHAKVWFNRPAYGKYQGRRYEDDCIGQSGVYNPDEGSE